MSKLNEQTEIIFCENPILDIQKNLEVLQIKRAFVLVDENTLEHCYSKIQIAFGIVKTELIILKSGEQNKSLLSVEKIISKLTKKKADKNSALFVIGGGVLSDIGGFAASIYKRGIPLILIPTTLLSMVDASIGGKNGVNFEGIKNLIGTFYHPQKIIISPFFLSTLPPNEIQSAWGEIIKHAIIDGGSLWLELLKTDIIIPKPNLELIQKAAAIKYKIVNEDPFEKGKRVVLNLGHTYAHALESYYFENGKSIEHGNAVLYGILAESVISYHFGYQDIKTLQSIFFVVNKINSKMDKWIELSELQSYLIQDKKNSNSNIHFVKVAGIGKVDSTFSLTLNQLKKLNLNELISEKCKL